MAEGNFKNLQECCEMANAYVIKFVDRKNDRIDQLKEQCHIISEAIKTDIAKVVEVEQLMQKKEEEYEATNNKHRQQIPELRQQYGDLSTK